MRLTFSISSSNDDDYLIDRSDEEYQDFESDDELGDGQYWNPDQRLMWIHPFTTFREILDYESPIENETLRQAIMRRTHRSTRVLKFRFNGSALEEHYEEWDVPIYQRIHTALYYEGDIEEDMMVMEVAPMSDYHWVTEIPYLEIKEYDENGTFICLWPEEDPEINNILVRGSVKAVLSNVVERVVTRMGDNSSSSNFLEDDDSDEESSGEAAGVAAAAGVAEEAVVEVNNESSKDDRKPPAKRSRTE